jgi:hypothetical protein
VSLQWLLGSCGFDFTFDRCSNKKHEASDLEPGEQNDCRPE